MNNTKEEEIKSKEDTNLNKSLLRQNIMCNHCKYACENYEKMKEHYSSDFHKYNLNRVTLNFAPISYEEYNAKKQAYIKKIEEQKKNKTENIPENTVLLCDICYKKFTTRKKLEEHYKSKAHIKKENESKNNKIQEHKQTKKPTEKEATTLDDKTICLFCNKKTESLENNFIHMRDEHKLFIPLVFCIKNYNGLISILAQKIFTYNSCLFCDTQKFGHYKDLQKHMLDKGHTYINDTDLEDVLFKYYSKKKLRELKDSKWTKMKEYKILTLRIKVEEQLRKEDNKDNEWEEESDSNEDNDIFDPLVLPSGELLLEDGTVLGNKIYKIYYQQRIKLNSVEEAHGNDINERNVNKKIIKKRIVRYNNALRGRRRNMPNLKGNIKYKYLKKR